MDIKARVREVAASTSQKPSAIINPILNDASSLVTLPVKSNLAKIVKRVQKSTNQEPPLPNSLADLEIPDKYKSYENG